MHVGNYGRLPKVIVKEKAISCPIWKCQILDCSRLGRQRDRPLSSQVVQAIQKQPLN